MCYYILTLATLKLCYGNELFLDSGSNTTGYSSEVTYSTIMNAVDEMSKLRNSDTNKNSMTNIHSPGENVTDSSSSIPQKGEVFRSMNVNDASKTPYSDATQVRTSSPNKQVILDAFN